MKFYGSEKQIKWANEIMSKTDLSEQQIDALMRVSGPTKYAQKLMSARLVIEQRFNLPGYANTMIEFLKLTPAEKHEVAVEACRALGSIARNNLK